MKRSKREPKSKTPLLKKKPSPDMKKHDEILSMICDPATPWMHRAAMLQNLLATMNPETQPLILRILELLSAQAAESLCTEKLAKLNSLLKELREGPLRQGVFIDLMTGPAFNPDAPQALVVLDDGTLLYSVVPETALVQELSAGDRVILDAKAHAILYRDPVNLKVGEEVQLERRLDDRHVEVSHRGEKSVLFAARALMDEVKEGRVSPGASIIVNPRQHLAVAALPPQDGLSHFRFLDKGPIPDVRTERDIGCPPRCIQDVTSHIRLELTRPELRRSLKLRPCKMKLLSGTSGSGKTLAIQAIHRNMYEVMSEVTGLPMDKLPPRVFRFRSGHLLNQWLGNSDKNIERIFDEIEMLAGQPCPTADGRSILLPVLVIIEEADGLGRSRGQDAIYDRLLTVMLQRLDPNREGLRDKLVVFLATTNEPQIVDPAFLRRVGGSVETFGRLNRTAFKAVLQKHLRDMPALSNNGYSQEELRRQFVNGITAWLFNPNPSEPGLLEMTYAGSTTPVIKYRRDFLTGALVDRAVQQAAEEACQSAMHDVSNTAPAVSQEQLVRALDEQIRGVLAQVRESNIGSYTDVPLGLRVANLRRLAQPTLLPFSLQRQEPNQSSTPRHDPDPNGSQTQHHPNPITP